MGKSYSNHSRSPLCYNYLMALETINQFLSHLMNSRVPGTCPLTTEWMNSWQIYIDLLRISEFSSLNCGVCQFWVLVFFLWCPLVSFYLGGIPQLYCVWERWRSQSRCVGGWGWELHLKATGKQKPGGLCKFILSPLLLFDWWVFFSFSKTSGMVTLCGSRQKPLPWQSDEA